MYNKMYMRQMVIKLESVGFVWNKKNVELFVNFFLSFFKGHVRSISEKNKITSIDDVA